MNFKPMNHHLGSLVFTQVKITCFYVHSQETATILSLNLHVLCMHMLATCPCSLGVSIVK